MSAPAIVWLRRDLRLADQAAFAAAAASGPVIPVYVLDDETPKHRRLGGAARWWLHRSLESLAASLDAAGSRLVLRRGKADEVLAALAGETGAEAIHCLRHYEPWWRNAEKALAGALQGKAKLICHDGNYLMPPGSITSGSGQPYKIYTPFWRALMTHMPPDAPVPAPDRLEAPPSWPASDDLADWQLLPAAPDWATGFVAVWEPGEAAAHRRLGAFAGEAARYDHRRNLPSIDGSSRLSPHLHWGELSPAQVWHAVADACGAGRAETYLKELVWRDFAQHTVLDFPELGSRSYRDAFDAMPWRDTSRGEALADFRAWTKGRTGYPVVDAGMRQLWATGWMHNRVRMIAASFLIKHLLIDWREGERWFWDTLVDADYASNGLNWQWVAGTGADSSMFSRIMAPLAQSEKFEAAGYIRQWVPELAGLPDDAIHDPEAAGCRPQGYPAKRIGHREARERALAAYRRIKA